MSNATTRGARPDSRTPRKFPIQVENIPLTGHSSTLTRTLPNDPHVVACPSCGARRMEPCTWKRRPRGLTVHARRSALWLRTVERENALARWVEFPDDNTPEALAERRAEMWRRWCHEVDLTETLLRMHRLDRAVLDLTSCPEVER
ncbi:zinc finger domain-containing protein [Microbacterium sp.]|uniref:zinc finger domain-containing protein n=1 Tax=Microbacterium sp. TaxID=51671 RepID=UPI003C758B90